MEYMVVLLGNSKGVESFKVYLKDLSQLLEFSTLAQL